MKTQPQLKHIMATLAIAGLAATLAGCGGSDDSGNPMTVPPGAPGPVAGSMFAATALVTDSGTTAAHTDANLINPWGLVFNPTGFSWVANDGTSTSTLYDGKGVPQSLVVTLPPAALGVNKPTGIVFNGTQDFKVGANGLSGASVFIFAGQSGSIVGWSPSVDMTHALTAVDNGATGALYKGLAISSISGSNFIYATDFHNNRVDVFDGNFKPVTLPGAFTDPKLPANYAPFGIQAIGGNIFVTYVPQDPTSHAQVFGAGLGMVDEFDSSGKLIKQLVMPGGALNNPWGMAMAPANFGIFSNDLLVANFGDGKINAYDPSTGKQVGTLSDSTGAPLVNPGLWSIVFGNGVNSQPTNTLFFTAGSGDGKHGTYGRVDLTN